MTELTEGMIDAAIDAYRESLPTWCVAYHDKELHRQRFGGFSRLLSGHRRDMRPAMKKALIAALEHNEGNE